MLRVDLAAARLYAMFDAIDVLFVAGRLDHHVRCTHRF